MMPEIVIVVRDGRVDSVFSDDVMVNVSVIDFDTDDPDQAEENETAGKELQRQIESCEMSQIL